MAAAFSRRGSYKGASLAHRLRGAALPIHHLVVLALVQGITEFLPISSSGHLYLTSNVLGWPDQGLLIDVAVHVGTLAAVIVYFWRDLWAMTVGLLRLLSGGGGPGAKLAAQVALATLPVVVAGFAFKDIIEGQLRSVEVIAWATIGFAIALWLADRMGMTVRRIDHLTYPHALFIGFMQALALIPGTSRAGITMTAGRALGMEREEAARFSMLLSIPAILGAGTLSGLDLYRADDFQLGLDAALAAGLAFVSALVAIWGLLAWLRHAGFGPFVVYRIALGVGLLAWVYF